MKYVKSLEEPHCGDCRNYHQHYVLTRGRYVKCHCGHCHVPKVRRMIYDCVPCEHYDPKPAPMKFIRKRSRVRYF